MADRSAIDTIRGYYYQFDYSIATLMNLSNNTDSIVIEGVEDIDIKIATETTAVQCKYYEKTEYNHSVIAEPIRLMLNHFKDVKEGKQTELNYKLRGYYKSGQSKLILPLSLQNLKDNFLTYTRTEKVSGKDTKVKHFHHSELNLDDSDLLKFLTLLELDIQAKEFEQQYNDIIKLLKNEFKCSYFVAENYYYNSALKVIRNLSKDSNILNRRISKSDFLKTINNSQIIFYEWFIKIKGEKLHLANLKKEYFSNLNVLFKERFFLIDVSSGTLSRTDIKELLYLIIKKYTKIINQPNPFCPYVYLHGISRDELVEIKTDLIEDNILLNDGFDFEGAIYNPNSILSKPNISYPVKLKFVNDISYLNPTLKLTGRKSEIYQFYIQSRFFNLNDPSIKEIAIQINELINIKSII